MQFSGIKHWYVLVSFFLYVIFWGASRCCERYFPLLVLIGISVLNIILMVSGVPDYWYMSNYTFLLGMVASLNKEKLVKKADYKILILLALLFVVSSVIYAKSSTVFPIYFLFKNLSAVVWGAVVVEILLLFPISNRLGQELGKCSLFLYVIHMNILVFLEEHQLITFELLGLSLCISFTVAFLLNKVYLYLLQKIVKIA